MKFASYIFACAFITLFACKDNNNVNPTNVLPPETQTGQNTFGCIVNGRTWVPSAPFPLNDLTVDYYQGTFFVRATLKKDDRYHIILICSDSTVISGNYLLNNSLYKQAQFYDFNTRCTFKTNPNNLGYLEMTRVDTINGIFSGRFHFKIGIPGGCDTIRVKDGRFDLKR